MSNIQKRDARTLQTNRAVSTMRSLVTGDVQMTNSARKPIAPADAAIYVSDRMYAEGLRSGIPAVAEIVANAIQNAIDSNGPIATGEMTAEHAETFLTSVKLDLDCNDISENTLRWFATFSLWSNSRPHV